MSKQSDPKDKTNFIENPEERARELFGYDDESLLRELKAAELELELMKAEDPELEAQIQAETEAGFDALMQKIHAENMKPVTEREYSEKKREEERKVTKLRPVLKVMFVAAAILVVLSGMGVVVSARKEFEYQKLTVGDKKNEMVWRNDGHRQTVGGVENAYKVIKDEIGIDVLRLNYIPKGMNFEDIIINKGHATLEFIYMGKKMHFKQIKYPVDEVSERIVSDRVDKTEVYNAWLDLTLYIDENILDDSQREYSVDIDLNDAHYYLSGSIDKDQFIKIVEEISYYNN